MSKEKIQNGTTNRREHNPFVYWFTVIILILIIGSFIILPAFTRDTAKGSNKYWGSFDNKKILVSNDYFRNILRRIDEYYKSQYGKNLNESFQRQLLKQTYKDAYMFTMQKFAIDRLAEKGDIVVSVDKVEQLVVDILKQSENYIENFAQQSASERRNFEISQEEEYLRKVVLEDLEKIPDATKEELDFLKNVQTETRAINYIKVAKESIDDNFYIDYAVENSEKFTQYKLSQITVATKSEADDIIDLIKEDITIFSDLAKESSIDEFANDGGKTSYKFLYQIEDDFKVKNIAKKIDLEVDEFTSPIKVENGFIILKNDAQIIIPDETNMKSKISDIKSFIAINDEEVTEVKMSELTDSIYEKAVESSLKDASKEFDVEFVATKDFGINYENSSYLENIESTTNSSVLTDLSGEEDFFIDVFSAEKDKVSDVLFFDDYNLIYEVSNINTDGFEVEEDMEDLIEKSKSVISYISTSGYEVNNFEDTYNYYFGQ